MNPHVCISYHTKNCYNINYTFPLILFKSKINRRNDVLKYMRCLWLPNILFEATFNSYLKSNSFNLYQYQSSLKRIAVNKIIVMNEVSTGIEKKPEFKYKIGKVRQTPSVQTEPETGLTYIQLKARNDERIFGCTTFKGHYREEKKLGQGTFGEVYKGIHLETQRQVAMKRIIVNVEKDLFPITAQREITILRRLSHKNIIKLIEMVYDHSPEDSTSRSSTPSNSQQNSTVLNKSFYMILPYMIADLSGVLHNPRINLTMCNIKNIMLQLLEGINYIHCEKFMHRDIKAANILIDHNGVLKLADFGLARMYYGAPPNMIYPGGAGMGAKYTSVVVTRWYRAPELVLGDKQYTTAVDIWGIGCVFAECFEKKPILQGTSDVDQGHVIFKLMGTPTEEDWELARYLPGAELTRTNYQETLTERFEKYLNSTGLDFLRKLLALDPYKRLTAMSAIHHPWFKEEPLPSLELSVLSEESHEADIKRYKEEMNQTMSTKAPTASKGHINDLTDTECKSYVSPHVNVNVNVNTNPNKRVLQRTQSTPQKQYSRDQPSPMRNIASRYDSTEKKPVVNAIPQFPKHPKQFNKPNSNIATFADITPKSRYHPSSENPNTAYYKGNQKHINNQNSYYGSYNGAHKRPNPAYQNNTSDTENGKYNNKRQDQGLSFIRVVSENETRDDQISTPQNTLNNERTFRRGNNQSYSQGGSQVTSQDTHRNGQGTSNYNPRKNNNNSENTRIKSNTQTYVTRSGTNEKHASPQEADLSNLIPNKSSVKNSKQAPSDFNGKDQNFADFY